MVEVDVKNLETIAETINSLSHISKETEEQCGEGLRTAQQILFDAENELNTSNNILNVCKTVEAVKLAKKLEVSKSSLCS